MRPLILVLLTLTFPVLASSAAQAHDIDQYCVYVGDRVVCVDTP